MKDQVHIIEVADKDQRLDRYLTKTLNEIDQFADHSGILSRTFVTENVVQLVLINGKKVKPSYKLKPGDKLELPIEDISKKINEAEELRSETIIANPGKLNILVEEKDYLIINKSHGIVVHPGVGHKKDTLANHLKAYMIDSGDYDRSLERAGIVHRLDKAVGGLMVVAKNKKMQDHLKLQFESHNVLKLYMAEVEKKDSVPKEIPKKDYQRSVEELRSSWIEEKLDQVDGWFDIEGYITRDDNDRIKMKFSKVPLNKRSKFSKSLLVNFGEGRLGIRIVTGRMHQIRATLKFFGLSIKGDTLYGKGRKIPDKIDLRSTVLGFRDLNNEPIAIIL